MNSSLVGRSLACYAPVPMSDPIRFLSPIEKEILQIVGQHFLKAGGSIKGIEIRTPLRSVPNVDSLLDNLVPDLLHKAGEHPHEFYRPTMLGFMQTRWGAGFAIGVEKMLSFLRNRLDEKPGFQHYDWEEVRKATGLDDKGFQLVRAAILISGFGGSGNYGSDSFRFSVPNDLEVLIRLSGFDEVLDYRMNREREEPFEPVGEKTKRKQVPPDKNTRVERCVGWLKNNKLASFLILAGMVIVALDTVTGSIRNLMPGESGYEYKLVLSEIRRSDVLSEDAEWSPWSEAPIPEVRGKVKGEDPHVFTMVSIDLPSGAEPMPQEVECQGGSGWGKWEGEPRITRSNDKVVVTRRYKSWYSHAGKVSMRVKYRRRISQEQRVEHEAQFLDEDGEKFLGSLPSRGQFRVPLSEDYASFSLHLFPTDKDAIVLNPGNLVQGRAEVVLKASDGSARLQLHLR